VTANDRTIARQQTSRLWTLRDTTTSAARSPGVKFVRRQRAPLRRSRPVAVPSIEARRSGDRGTLLAVLRSPWTAFRGRRVVRQPRLTVSIAQPYQWAHCLSARPIFRSSAERYLRVHPPASSPARNAGLTEPLPSRRGSFFRNSSAESSFATTSASSAGAGMGFMPGDARGTGASGRVRHFIGARFCNGSTCERVRHYLNWPRRRIDFNFFSRNENRPCLLSNSCTSSAWADKGFLFVSYIFTRLGKRCDDLKRTIKLSTI
jgi:hypothetical protein